MNVYVYIDKFPSSLLMLESSAAIENEIALRLYARCIVSPMILTARAGYHNDDLVNDLVTVYATLLIDNPF